MPSNPIKIICVGDGSVGKTSLLHRFADGEFPKEYVPTVFENKKKSMHFQGKDYELMLWDTAGQEGYERVRRMSYKNVQLVLCCYAIDNIASLENVQNVWSKEIQKFAPTSVQIIVGLKSDLRGTSKKVCLTTNQGAEIARKVGATRHVECSAMNDVGVEQVFEQAVIALVASGSKKKDDKCVVM